MTPKRRPQMPPITDTTRLDALFAEQTMGVLSTHNADGTIHSAPTFFLVDGGAFLMGTQEGAQRLANLRRDPRATLLVERRSEPLRYAIVYGTAEVGPGDPERRIEILKRVYPEEEARAFLDWLRSEWPLVEVRLRPERMVTVDYEA